MRRLLLAGALALIVRPAHAGTLDDMNLRSNVETAIRGSAPTANLHLKIDVENGVALPAGLVRDLNQADEVATLAAKVRGIVAVDRSRLKIEYPAPPDEQLAAKVAFVLFAIPRYTPSAITITAVQGVVTLHGTIKNGAWRGEIRKICGAIEGVAELVDRLTTPETPEPRIQKALDTIFSPRATPRFPGRVHAVAKDGIVTLEGTVPRLYDKVIAQQQALSINGVLAVEDLLVLGSGTTIKVIQP